MPPPTNTPGPTPTPQLTITFERIWSDQFGGVEINFLPGGSGRVTNYVYMGARANDMAQGAARLSFSPSDPALRTNLYVRFCLLPPVYGGNPPVEIPAPNGGVPLGDGSLFSNVALVGYDSSQPPMNMNSEAGAAICVGFDTNGNYNLDPEEITQISPQHFLIVNNNQYETARIECSTGAWLAHWPSIFSFHWASEFMSFFLGGSPPVGTTDTNVTIQANDPRLSHRVGALFNASGLAPGKELLAGSGSEIVEDILEETRLRQNIIWPTLVALRSMNTVREYFSQPPGNQEPLHTFDPFPLTENGFIFSDADLFLSFGGVTITGNVTVTVRRSDMVMTECRIQGQITDMYDWNMEEWGMDRIPGTVQAGYNTLGDSGRIFLSRIILDNIVEGIQFTF